MFALAEKQPGFAKVFFYLEQEAMKPRYEIHSIGMPEVVTTARNDLAGRALFAATEMTSGNEFEREFGRTLPQERYAAYSNRYWVRFQAQACELAERLSGSGGDLPAVLERLTAAGEPLVRDAWGRRNLRWRRGASASSNSR